MKVRRSTVTDGITSRTCETFEELDRPMTRADVERLQAAFEAYLAHVKSFERRLAELEAYCCGVVKRSPCELEAYLLTLPKRSPHYGSSAYYANEILHTIRNVRGLRDHLVGPVDPSYLDAYSGATARLATRVTEWQAKAWPELRRGLAHLKRTRDKARAAVEAKQRLEQAVTDRLVAADEELQGKRPDLKPGDRAGILARVFEQTLRPEIERALERKLKKSTLTADAIRMRLRRARKRRPTKPERSPGCVQSSMVPCVLMAEAQTPTPAQIVNEADAARYIDMSTHWLCSLRVKGEKTRTRRKIRNPGPPYLQIGRSIRYAIADLDRWLASTRTDPSSSRSNKTRLSQSPGARDARKAKRTRRR